MLPVSKKFQLVFFWLRSFDLNCQEKEGRKSWYWVEDAEKTHFWATFFWNVPLLYDFSHLHVVIVKSRFKPINFNAKMLHYTTPLFSLCPLKCLFKICCLRYGVPVLKSWELCIEYRNNLERKTFRLINSYLLIIVVHFFPQVIRKTKWTFLMRVFKNLKIFPYQNTFNGF